MNITVHTISGSPSGWRVLIGLALKGLEYDMRILQISKQEQKSAVFRKLNPRATVPVLEADGLVLRDSIGILAWLDRRFPTPPLFGETPDEAAEIWQVVLECCDYLRAAGRRMLVPILFGGGPLPEEGSAERDELNAAAEAMHAECRRLNDMLAETPFLAGAKPSAADAVVFPELRMVQRAVETKNEMMAPLGFGEPATRYPNVAAWKERVAALPGIDRTMPPHWSE